MSEPKVYLDLTFLINFIMDFIILWATLRLTTRRVNYARLTLASVLGALYAVVGLFPTGRAVYSLPLKLLFSCVMLLIALCPADWQEFRKGLFYFYGISFAAAGATLALPALFQSMADYQDLSYFWLGAGIICAFLIGIFGEKYLVQKIMPGLLKFNVEMRFDDRRCMGRGFLDTGNALRDPLTNRPVLVAEYSLLKDCLPEDCQLAIEGHDNENDMIDDLSCSSWAHRLRLIPFQSIGKKNGILLGIRADEIMVDAGKSSFFHQNMVVGIYRDKLSGDGSYRLLIPAAVLEKR